MTTPTVGGKPHWKDTVLVAINRYWPYVAAAGAFASVMWFIPNYFSTDWQPYRNGATDVLKYILADTNRIVGSFVHLVLIVIAFVFLRFLARVIIDISKEKLEFGVERAIRGLGRVTMRHAEVAVNSARKDVVKSSSVEKKHKRQWDELMVAALGGLSDPKVYLRHGEKHIDDLPVLFSNFECYAHSVRSVLNTVQSFDCDPAERIMIWTLLKRSLIEWYLPFPVDVPGATPAHVTYQWWEDYKKTVAGLRDTTKALQMRRLVAHPSTPIMLPGGWYVADEAIPLNRAAIPGTGNLHSVVQQALTNLHSLPADAQIRLIVDTRLPDGYAEVTTHFEQRYHIPGTPNKYDRGVFLRYLTTRDGIDDLLTYDDIFVVSLPCELHFGLAFINDEIHDVSGTRFVPSGTVSDWVKKLSQAWKNGQETFCTLV